MKYLLLLLALAGCHYTWHDTSCSENSCKIPEPGRNTINLSSSDGINNWNCSAEEINEKIVWIQCKFHNSWTANIAQNSVANSCVRVNVIYLPNNMVLASSRKVCSGPLKAGQNSSNFVAFNGKDRELLNKCGNNLEKCVMRAENANK